MADSRKDILVVNIVSASYSGSTWLNLMLGAHSRAFSVSEVDVIVKTGRASCTFHGEQCPIWSQFDFNAPEKVFVQIAEVADRRTLIVNNVRYLRHVFEHPRIDHRNIFLMRDGRAVVASTLRKRPDHSTWHAFDHGCAARRNVSAT